jgi:malyl-CoA/(S)-citramalyl-CoA lyase
VSPRVTRCYLAVPAHRRRMVEGAARSAADAVFLDLEDAVPPGAKGEALAGALAALDELDWGRKLVAVRINNVTGELAAREVAALAGPKRLDSLIVPKTENAAQLALVAGWLADRDPEGRIGIEALIETAAGVLRADEIAASGGRLAALQFGVGDFAASIGARSAEIGESPAGYALLSREAEGRYARSALDLWTYPMMRLLVAGRAHGLRVIDGPCGAFKDLTLTAAWAAKAAAMGFDGKQAIHPGQIGPIQAAFMPGAAEVDFARRVVAAMRAAEGSGRGAVSVDGKMIDYANLRMAERILGLAEVEG